MKRSFQEMLTKNEVMASQPKKRGVTTECVFDWLPLGIVEKIVEYVPWELDKITRLVNHAWCQGISRRWNNPNKAYTHRDCQCLGWAIGHDVLRLVKWMMAILHIKTPASGSWTRGKWMNHACWNGSTSVMGWLASEEAPAEFRCLPTKYDTALVAQRVDLACFRVCLELRGKSRPKLLDVYGACRGGKWKTVAWMRNHIGWSDKVSEFSGLLANPYTDFADCTVFDYCVTEACKGGHAIMVDWLLARGNELVLSGSRQVSSKQIVVCLQRGHSNLAKHLVNHWKCPVDDVKILEIICEDGWGDVERMRWFFDRVSVRVRRRFGCNPMVFIRHGDMDTSIKVMNLLFDKGCLIVMPSLFEYASENGGEAGCLRVMRWLWNRCTQVVVRRQLRNCDGPLHKHVFEQLTCRGYVEVLDWLQAMDLLPEKHELWFTAEQFRTVVFAQMESGMVRLLQWVWQNCNGGKIKSLLAWKKEGSKQQDIFIQAVWYCRCDVLDWLQGNDLLPKRGVLMVASDLFVEVVKDNGEQCLVMLQWLWEYCDQAGTRKGIFNDVVDGGCNRLFEEAIYWGAWDVVEWLQKRDLAWDPSDTTTRVSSDVLEKLENSSWDPAFNACPRLTVRHHLTGAKHIFLWLHRHGLADLSRARLVGNHKVWLHADCKHETTNQCQHLEEFLEVRKYLYAKAGSLAFVPWKEGRATGDYLIPRK